MELPTVSLVITTYNRAALLSEALESVAACEKPVNGLIEVIVVDNNSTDDTRTVVDRLSSDFPFPLEYVFEGAQGLSQARNRGSNESRASVVAFMDDDQRLDRSFLSRIDDVFRTTDADCVGGPIFYYNADNLPEWLPPLLENTGQYDGGRETKVLKPEGRKLNGGNMAFRRSVLHEIGGYNVDLGRSGGNLLASEEFELQERLFAENKRIVYSPSLVQYHYLRPERLKRNYWRRHHFDYGRTVYRRHLKGDQKYRSGATFLGGPRWLWRVFLIDDVKSYLSSIGRDRETRFKRQLGLFFRLGQIYEARMDRQSSETMSSY